MKQSIFLTGKFGSAPLPFKGGELVGGTIKLLSVSHGHYARPIQLRSKPHQIHGDHEQRAQSYNQEHNVAIG